jgi:hypothetical protein
MCLCGSPTNTMHIQRSQTISARDKNKSSQILKDFNKYFSFYNITNHLL